jgi:sulfur-oxidizing protein SoxY
MHRREFVRCLTGLAVLMSVPRLFAAWPKNAFSASTINGALENYFPDLKPQHSDAIFLKLPSMAENGAVVPVNIETDLLKVHAMAVLVAQNPFPLSAVYEMSAHALPFVSLRLKLAESSSVIAVVYSEGQLYMTKKFVEVTIGGCG